ncbi:MAG TPA: hypothetical protein PLN38_04800 [Chitinophagales bacterium]|jgi:hypothetical protein|nr:hypothetical protein [Chitinophagales bacterium]
MTREDTLKDFFNTALKGESKTYNDHNWYTSSGLRGYIQGSSGSPYSLLKKPLSSYTIGEVKAFQNRSRDNVGQLWATGRYQIIPSTLIGVASKAGLSNSDLYNEANQDAMAWQLLLERKPIADYIRGVVPDTLENRQKASMEMAKIWSSIGIPYAIAGKPYNHSYYGSKGDVASVTSEAIQQKLQQLRSGLGAAIDAGIQTVKETIAVAKSRPYITIGLTVVTVVAIYVIYTQLKSKRNG